MSGKNFAKLTQAGERKNIEFKENLNSKTHLFTERKQQLASQMKYRLERGYGEAIYFIGVDDNGQLLGLTQPEMNESLHVLGELAHEINSKIMDVETEPAGRGEVAKVIISRQQTNQPDHLLIGVAGHVDHGKSTLVGTLTTGSLDSGSGSTRIFLDVQKHEIERGLSADLSFAVYGFSEGETVRIKNPLNKREKALLVEKCDKLVSFVDTVGHEPWLRTTIRGIVGQKLSHGLLVVSADQGPTHITREHLGIILAMDLPVIVVITKIDMVSPERIKTVRQDIFDLLKLVGRIPYMVESPKDADFLTENMNHHLVPVIKASPVTGEGLEILDRLFSGLKIPSYEEDSKKPFMMYIDKIYSVVGVGTVVSGTIRQGTVKKGEKLILGPFSSGDFVPVNVRSIEMHHYRKENASVGEVVGISITGVEMTEIKRGMIICHPDYNPSAVREFDADVAILVHPTTIKEGYECITHIETIAETTCFKPIENEYLSAGDTGKIRMRFKYRPFAIREGQKLIFREGKSKGVGTVTRLVS
ncbi:GTPBP1 family GTP-binding protein [Methanobacterium petrolearium]|uniref:GTPBP1 family GTP-binding protein n=1 Tax=Methanobacterium petrolearium TaxID=710190 RepID=UPI001AE63256|nr:GTP-binding protein [Methanobacterium petrolearium]MBP1947055.1 elongation factor 1-alpha [Methanobacterium petrolearium]BDZ69700.1 GTP-binding protein [Methanobacterium petrolearium]